MDLECLLLLLPLVLVLVLVLSVMSISSPVTAPTMDEKSATVDSGCAFRCFT